jgi:glycosyltransferase involved in cell wall biosynthesis
VLEARRLQRIVADARPDVVHLHSAKAGLAGRLALRGRVSTIFQPHGWSWLAVEGRLRAAAERWERHALRWTDLLIAVGEGEAEEGRRHGMHGHQAVVRNGIDRSRFQPADDAARRAARAALGLDPDAPLVVCLGRVTRQKGQDVLLAAWPEVRRRCQSAQLQLVGDVQPGGPAVGLLELPAGAGWAPAVLDVRPWLAAADVVAVPSRWEGLALIVVEALAIGRPVVASDVPGIRELVTSSCGALVPADDAAGLAEAIAHRLGRPALMAQEGAEAARSAPAFDARHTWDRLAALTAALLGAGTMTRH